MTFGVASGVGGSDLAVRRYDVGCAGGHDTIAATGTRGVVGPGNSTIGIGGHGKFIAAFLC